LKPLETFVCPVFTWEFGCNGQSIRKWVTQAAVDGDKAPRGKEAVLTSAEREELFELAP
jgi:transposase-like protein